jgi:type IV pilus assembly protein PilB
MKISDNTVVQLLNDANKIAPEQLIALQEEVKKSSKPVQELAIKHELITDKDLTELYAKHINIPFVELNPQDITKEIVSIIPEKTAKQYNTVVFKTDEDGTRNIAMEDPDDVQAIDFIRKYIGSKFKVYIATKDNIAQALGAYREGVASELNDVIEVQREDEEEAQEQQVSEEEISEDSPIAKTVNLVLEYAIRSGASDIHIEPREEYVQIRYRVDGVLKEANRLPKNVLGALVSRIKILSNLKIDERRVPQDGRFKINITGKAYGLRVSTLPITDGEKVVMRILNESNKAATLEELGFWGWALENINSAIVQPHGMILVTGPTGSGKSTTLFSCLSLLNNPGVNISTVEDPVEYKVTGANQTQVNPKAGMTFVAGLRALLRQDPNIIMVGEIRDGETANLGVQAALTGHLVLSTLHTNNAATCLPRLLDMGIEPFLIASTVRAVIGQRLVRCLCPNCKEAYKPEDVELKQIDKMFNFTEEDYKKINDYEKKAAEQNIGKDSKDDLGSTETGIKKLWKPHEGGCNECNTTGYKGRMGIYEVLAGSDDIQKLIIGNGTSSQIQEQAIKEGMITMQLDGFIKALRGQTSIQEILRVTRE